jgi:hypothetical protein
VLPFSVSKSLSSLLPVGLVVDQVVHIDTTLIGADVAWESVGERHADAVLAEDEPGSPPPRTASPRLSGRPSGKPSATASRRANTRRSA